MTTSLLPGEATIGFVGLGNVGGKLAGSLLRNGFDLLVLDLDTALVEEFVGRGATAASSPRELAESCDVIITCLPNPVASAEVVEGPEGLAPFAFPFEWPDDPKLMSEGEIWSVVLTADWRGRVVGVEGWWAKAEDLRTPVILEKVRSREIVLLSEKGPLRVWRLEARVVNRPLAE